MDEHTRRPVAATLPRLAASQPPAPPRRTALSVDANHCALYGLCEQEAPDVFTLGVDGRLRYPPAVDAERVAAARQAARLCPMRAISLRDQP
ncbi:ferredoxin [Frankia sp. AgB1.9]|uniref:ferredoxin n=1 Tax=unclassified Frankia TaxID=2632575 RepID=UPI001933E806|nr:MULTISPECIES: ferredoxin [unclassified Frankia]MBL7489945.1 ferredoxin [Frankia sp. AgW1.1]MBL7552676.1 ferredoxin [Frankia sp. AgB1.9]MBL7623841.1 ferredoxin [Frankia sp. AgB1.8]